jgi:hypothetical protein
MVSWFLQFTFTLHVGVDCLLFPCLFHGSDCLPCLQLPCKMHCIFTLNMEAACWSKMTWCHNSQDCIRNCQFSVANREGGHDRAKKLHVLDSPLLLEFTFMQLL